MLRRYRTDDGLEFGQQRREVGFDDRTLVDLDPLRIGNQVRLRHQANAIAGRLKDARQHRAHRALAIGAGDVHALEKLLRIAQRAEEGLGSLQAKLDAEATERGQVVERLLIGHPSPRCWRYAR